MGVEFLLAGLAAGFFALLAGKKKCNGVTGGNGNGTVTGGAGRTAATPCGCKTPDVQTPTYNPAPLSVPLLEMAPDSGRPAYMVAAPVAPNYGDVFAHVPVNFAPSPGIINPSGH